MSDFNGCFHRAHALACLPTRHDLAGKPGGIGQSAHFTPPSTKKLKLEMNKPHDDALVYLFNFFVGAIDLPPLAPLLSPAKGGLPIPACTIHGGGTKIQLVGMGDVVMCCGGGGEVRWRFDTKVRWLQAR